MVAPFLDLKKKSTSKLVRKRPCPRCRRDDRDKTGDNLGVFDDGHCYCFSCGLWLRSLDKFSESGYTRLRDKERNTYESFSKEKDKQQHKELRVALSGCELPKDLMTSIEYTYEYLGARGISRETMEFYNARTKVDKAGIPVAMAFPYGSYTIVRTLPEKAFTTIGSGQAPLLFGQEKFNQGSAKSITVTEGAYDAMSIYECLGRKYPAVSVRSAPTARQDCEHSYHYLNSFENIYLCFDNDKPGQDAAREVASLFDVNKVYHVKLDKWKDANEALQGGQADEVRRIWYNAKTYQPDGLVDVYSSAHDILSREDAQATATYPFDTLQHMSYGIRVGELVLFTALEKVGKTEVLRAIEYHLLKTTQDAVGIIHLEEQEKRSVQGLVGYELGVPAHLPDSGISLDDQKLAIANLVKTPGRLFMHSHFGSDSPDDVLNLIRYMVVVNKCKYIFLDHLTMLVSGLEGEDERRKLDYLSTRLARLTRELKFTLFLVSHVNDEGQTRGSRMPSKLCDLEIYLSREKESTDATLRNRTRLMVRNNRFSGSTGPAGELTFNPKTFKLVEEAPAKEEVSGIF